MEQIIRWNDLDKSDLLIIGLKSVCFEELVTLERDQQYIAGYIRCRLDPPIYKAEPELAEYDFSLTFHYIASFRQSGAWTRKARGAAETALKEAGIEPMLIENLINECFASVPLYKPGQMVDFRGYLESLDEGRGIKRIR